MKSLLTTTLAVVLGCGGIALAGPKDAPAYLPPVTRVTHQQAADSLPPIAVETIAAPAEAMPAAPEAAPAAPAAPAAAPAMVISTAPAGPCCGQACNTCQPCGKPARKKRNCFECGDYCEIVKLWLWEIGQCLHGK